MRESSVGRKNLGQVMQQQRMTDSVFWTLGIGVTFGMVYVMLFQASSDLLIGTLSVSFLFLVPMGIGALTVALAPVRRKESWPYAVFMPWLVCLLVGLLVGVLAMEAWACIVIGLPVFFIMSSIGGALTKVMFDARSGNGTLGAWLGVAAIAPLFLMPIEVQWTPVGTTRDVVKTVVIEAPAEQVWASFVAVPPIQPDERPIAWFPWLGLPQPVEARLEQPGETGMRWASYENGMQVIEPTIIWEPARQYRFGVMLDPGGPRTTPLWTALAGEHLVVDHVEYRIDPVPGATGSVRLTLTGRYTLRTPLDSYAGVWIDFLLGDFERTILHVVKERAEAGAGRTR